MKALSHWSHLWGFSPVCLNAWRDSSAGVLKALSQPSTSHLWGFSSWCTRRWTLPICKMNILNHVINIFSLCAPRLRENALNFCHCRLVVKVYSEECVVPENINIHPMEGCWKFWEGGAFKSKFLKESVKQNWTFQIRGWWGGSVSGGGGGGVYIPQQQPWGSMDICWNNNNTFP